MTVGEMESALRAVMSDCERQGRTAVARPLMPRQAGAANVYSAPSSADICEAGGRTLVLNALTVDVEDYFHASAFDGCVARSQWTAADSRVARNVDRLLEVFDAAGVRATFFILGWVADHHPDVVRRIRDAGHELASHGYAHELVYATTPEGFRFDLRRARRSIQRASGVSVVGYRAPSFSITKRSLWALDVLVEEGYTYDASIYPIRHDRYGMPSSPRHMHRVQRPRGGLWELPGSTVRLAGVNLPIAGGGYFRLLPYWWTARGIARVNQLEGRPAIFYIHPWEIDAEQPRLPVRGLTRIRHYRNLEKTEERLRRLLADFRFGTVSQVLAASAGARSMEVMK
jgi:polysaccharide deacetylase family protein (PEP-CTERM system associated)